MVTQSNKCVDDCLKAPRKYFCQLENDRSGGYCCDEEGCPKYKDKKWNFCTNDVSLTAIQQMSCPFDSKKCSGGSKSSIQDVIKLPLDGKSVSLQPQSQLSRSDFCYYQIEAGREEDSDRARDDDISLLEVDFIMGNVRITVIIAKSLTDPFVD